MGLLLLQSYSWKWTPYCQTPSQNANLRLPLTRQPPQPSYPIAAKLVVMILISAINTAFGAKIENKVQLCKKRCNSPPERCNSALIRCN